MLSPEGVSGSVETTARTTGLVLGVLARRRRLRRHDRWSRDRLLDHQARQLSVSSTKGATGHCLGAAGAIEAVYTVLAVREAVVPPTINYETPDPQCRLDYTPNQARERSIRYALSNSFGFGGQNAVLAFRRWS